MSRAGVILLSGLLVLALLMFSGFILHVRYVSSRPLSATFGSVAVSAMILAVSGLLIMFLLSVLD